MRECDRTKVIIGNALMVFSAQVVRSCVQLCIPATLENPVRSRLWICPPMKYVLRLRNVVFNISEFCQWGTPWRKSTGFLAVHLDLSPVAAHRCLGAKRGLCKRTNLPHVVLAGLDANKQFLTKIAEPYPVKLCNAIAKCFRNSQVATIAKNFERRLTPVF